MGRVLLDTTVLVDVLRGRPLTIDRVDGLEPKGDQPFVCAVSIEELMSGLRPRESEAATDLLQGLSVSPIGMPEGRLAGYWRRRYRQRGITLTQADCLIAATAIELGARLATGNPRDFPMKGLEVEHWPVGE